MARSARSRRRRTHPAYSDAARCRVATGQCGCQRVEGQPTGTCTVRPHPRAQACVEAAHAP
ncbi:MAG: hypothetical protein R3F43_21090 [bacterium]